MADKQSTNVRDAIEHTRRVIQTLRRKVRETKAKVDQEWQTLRASQRNSRPH